MGEGIRTVSSIAYKFRDMDAQLKAAWIIAVVFGVAALTGVVVLFVFFPLVMLAIVGGLTAVLALSFMIMVFQDSY